jgi:formamidopyrimidine-DNA glycosylase
VRRELAPWLCGRTVIAAERVDAPPGPKYAGLERLPGRRIEAVTRRGKFLLLPLSGRPSAELIVHLGMTGVLSATPPADHVRVRLRLAGAEPSTLYFRDVRRFGRFTVVPAGEHSTLPTLAAMGPDALAPEFTAEALARALARSGTAIKPLLLSQRAVAGVGNIYADEALWRARVHPERGARRLSAREVTALHRAIRAVLEESVALQGTTLHDYRTVGGRVGSFSEHLAVYGHAGEPCRRCGTELVRLVVGQRGTHVCPRCQPRPRAAAGRQRPQRARVPSGPRRRGSA